MIIVAVARVSGAYIHHAIIDVQWLVFLHDVEANIAIIMVSITAFRSLLGLKARRSHENKKRAWYWYGQKPMFRKENKNSSLDSNEDQFPSIPDTTLTGIRTFIWGNQDTQMMASRIKGTDSMSSGGSSTQMAE